MSTQTPPSALLDGRVSDGGRAMQHAFLWILASLATAAALLSVMLLVHARNEREAGRMLIDAQKGTGYLLTVFSGVAAAQGRPNRY